jgi:hypothetical protein
MRPCLKLIDRLSPPREFLKCAFVCFRSESGRTPNLLMQLQNSAAVILQVPCSRGPLSRLSVSQSFTNTFVSSTGVEALSYSLLPIAELLLSQRFCS